MNESSLEITQRIEALIQAVVADQTTGEIWVGFSGGVDSTALLLACHRVILRQHPRVILRALHVNHGLQEHADDWAEHCTDFCQHLGIELIVASPEVALSGNMEANARAARYQTFAAHVGNGAVLLLGHHQQDQTETVLYRLFQGRGLLPMRSAGQIGAGRFMRPLLSADREQMVAYVVALGGAWIEDESNSDINLVRNFLRHKIIPGLTERWQDLHRSVRRVARHQVVTNAALQHALTGLGDSVPLAILPIEADVRLAWLRAYLHTRGVHSVSDKALYEFDAQLSSGGHAQLHSAPATLHAYADRLFFEAATAQVEAGPYWLSLGDEIALGFGSLQLRSTTSMEPLAFAYTGPLQVRFRAGGERIRVGPEGRTQLLKRLFSEARIPPWRRGCYPLLYRHDQLVCVPGLAVSEDVVAAPGDRNERENICLAVWRGNPTEGDNG